jgi:hypothetical protein
MFTGTIVAYLKQGFSPPTVRPAAVTASNAGALRTVCRTQCHEMCSMVSCSPHEQLAPTPPAWRTIRSVVSRPPAISRLRTPCLALGSCSGGGGICAPASNGEGSPSTRLCVLGPRLAQPQQQQVSRQLLQTSVSSSRLPSGRASTGPRLMCHNLVLIVATEALTSLGTTSPRYIIQHAIYPP